MTENQEEEMPEVMFVCGGQTTNDGDMLPEAFTVFPITFDPEDAAIIIVKKLQVHTEKLGMDRSTGQIELRTITSWGDWAELDLDPYVKMQALISAITVEYIGSQLRHASKVSQIASVPWIPPEHFQS